MNLWIGWNQTYIYQSFLLGLICIILSINYKLQLIFSKRNLILLIILLFSHYYINKQSIGLLGFITNFITFTYIICLPDNDKIYCLSYIRKWYAYLMIPSIITYFVVHFIPSIPPLGFLKWGTDSNYGTYLNYFFYLKSEFYGIRFNGPFLEPGHLGMMSAFLLFTNKFNLKDKTTKILILSVLLSLSLAGVVLSVIGYIFVKYYNHEIRLKWLIFVLISILLLYIIGLTYNNGNNIINDYILSRLQPDDEAGFSGNNRIYGICLTYYINMWGDMNLLFNGYDPMTTKWLLSQENTGGTGLKMWILIYGLKGLIVTALFYIGGIILSKEKKYAILAFVFVCLMFWQRSYPFWYSWIICYLYSIINEEKSSKTLIYYENRYFNIS